MCEKDEGRIKKKLFFKNRGQNQSYQLAIRRQGQMYIRDSYSIILKGWAIVFDHLPITHQKLLDMTIDILIIRKKIFIVTGDRD